MRNNISDYRFSKFEERISEEFNHLDRRVKNLEIDKASSNRIQEIDGYTTLDTRVRMLENSERWKRMVGSTRTEPPVRTGVTFEAQPITNRTSSSTSIKKYSKIDDFSKYEPCLQAGRVSDMLKRRKYDRWLFGSDKRINIPVTHTSTDIKTKVDDDDAMPLEDDFLSLLRDIRQKSDRIMELLQRNARDIVECKAIASQL